MSQEQKRFPVITLSESAYTLMEEAIAAALHMGEAKTPTEIEAAYTGLSRCRERLALFLQSLERAALDNAPVTKTTIRVVRTVRYR